MAITGLSIQAQSAKDIKTKKPNTRILMDPDINIDGLKIKNAKKLDTINYHNLTGVYTADQKTFYYVRHVDNKVYWYAESKDLSTSEVAFGELRSNRFNMYVVSTAKDKEGDDYLRANNLWYYNDEGQLFTKGTSPIVLNKTQRQTDQMHFPIRKKSYRTWKPKGCNQVDGEWLGTDGSAYYVSASNGKLIWFGESGHPKGGNHSNFWSNVFVGDLSILDDGSWDAEGTFLDVPKGTFLGSGKLKVNIKNNRMTAYPGASFGTTTWYREDAAYLKMEITNLKALSDEDLDWFGLISVGDEQFGISEKVGTVEIGDGNPKWAIESLHNMDYAKGLDGYKVVKIAVINMQDEDGFLAGEGDDLIDLSPFPEATALELYMDFERRIYVGYEHNRSIKLKEVGRAIGNSFTLKGDTNANSPGDGMEVGQITIRITDILY